MTETLLRNLRQSLRQLLQQPTFSLTVILSLAFGIGGTVAVFSLVDAILLRPLQFKNESKLVQVWESRPALGLDRDPAAAANYSDFKTRNHVFTKMGAASGGLFAITGDGRPQQVEGTRITADLLPVLGVTPLLGRNFSPEEDRPGGPQVALISASLWRTRFASDPHITGRTIRLNGVPCSIVGVMPSGFTFQQSSDVWTPLALSDAQLRSRGDHFLLVYGLLRNSITLDDVRRDLAGVARQLQQEFPADNTGVTTSVVPLREQIVGKVRPAIFVLCVGVLTILLTTCANIAGLMIARSTSRERDLSVKTALGATSTALFREHLIECAVLSLLGAVAGVLLSAATVSLLGSLVPVSLAAWAHPEIDGRALVFALVTALLAAVFFSVASQLFITTTSSVTLRHGRATMSSDRHVIRSLLVGTQVALTTVILIATSLLGQTFWRLAHADLGYVPEHVLTMRTELPVSELTPYRDFQVRSSFYRRVLEQVSHIPGVQAAGYTTFLPLTNGGGLKGIVPAGAKPPRPGQWNDATVRVITPGYFDAIGAHLIAGRMLSDGDDQKHVAVAIINQSLAHRFWGTLDPIGRHFRFTDVDADVTIVGVAADLHDVNVKTEPAPEIFLSYLQDLAPGYFRPRDLALRVSGDPARYAPAVRQAIWSIDPQQPVSSIGTLSAIVEDRLAPYQLEARLFGWFAAASLLLSSVGIYGLLSYDVARRTREIGLRMALGAQRSTVIGKFVGSALWLCLLGLIAGGGASFLLAGVLRGVLYGVAGWDATSRIAAAFVITCVCLLAAWLPAAKAARVDPLTALRAE